MEKDGIGPGTAGIAQRVSSGKAEERGESELFILKFDDPASCSQNQY